MSRVRGVNNLDGYLENPAQVTILTDTSPAGMIAAIEANIWGAWQTSAESAEVEVYDGPEMLRYASGIPMAPLNGVLRTRLEPGEADDVIEATLEYFEWRDVPMNWTVEPSAKPDDLGVRLMAKGLVPEDEEEPGMAMELEALGGAPGQPANLEIERVPTDEWQGDFADVMAGGFGFPGSAHKDFVRILAAGSDARPGTLYGYVGRLDGRPVATSMLLLAAGAAGIHNVTTLEDARHQGVGTAMTYAPLIEARDLGYKIAILQSSEMGLNAYKRLGFREYCMFQRFQ
jgi:GNAT superfamily N-acetyltransferase